MNNGKKSTLAPSIVSQDIKIDTAIISTLAFFALYELPLSSKRIFELLSYKTTLEEVETALEILVLDHRVIRANNLYSVKNWNQATVNARQLEITKKWVKVDRFFNWLSVVPFIRHMSVINSLGLGTADSDSDIDFFVITKPNRLYFVRSLIIVLFRLLGVYKTRQRIKDRFCFGFFVTQDNLSFEHLLIKPQDPYFHYWLANMRPVFGGEQYWHLLQANPWVTDNFPNLVPMKRLISAKEPKIWIKFIKFALEVVFWIPAALTEPVFRRIHIRHTFKLAENSTVTSTTIANAKMLKLHGLDVRSDVARAHETLLQSL